jgi:hypothetical protein
MRTDTDVTNDRHPSPETPPHVGHGGEDLRTQGRALRRAIPEVYRGFAGLRDAETRRDDVTADR